MEWFFGYGGNHLGLKRVIPNLRLIAACEIEGYAAANMVAKMEAGLLDAAPCWSDCKTFPVEMFRGLVDLFIASYPCQGFSAAGQRKGQADPRFLWPWVLRAVAVIQPRYCFFENVEGHVSLGLNTVISDLEEAGYRVKEGIFSAAECGAPQRRKRVFILGERRDLANDHGTGFGKREENIRGSEFNRAGEEQLANHSGERCGEGRAESGGKQGRPDASECGDAEVGNANSERSGAPGTDQAQGRAAATTGATGELGNASSNDERRDAMSGEDGERIKAGRSSGELADTASLGEREPHDEERTDTRKNAGGRSDERMEKSECCGRHKIQSEVARKRASEHAFKPGSFYWPECISRPGEQQHRWEPPRIIETQRGLGGGVNGRAANVDRLRLLGNGVYPATAERAFLTLYRRLHP